MQDAEIIKLAYGLGCISTLSQYGVDAHDFIKTAAESNDEATLKMADAIACVANHADTMPEATEKIASVVFDEEKTAAKGMAMGAEALEGLAGLAGKAKKGIGDAVSGAREAVDSAQHTFRQWNPEAGVIPHHIAEGPLGMPRNPYANQAFEQVQKNPEIASLGAYAGLLREQLPEFLGGGTRAKLPAAWDQNASIADLLG